MLPSGYCTVACCLLLIEGDIGPLVQVALQEAVRRLVAAGGDGSGCWAPGEERRLAQALEGGLAGLGEGCLGATAVALGPGLAWLAAAAALLEAVLYCLGAHCVISCVPVLFLHSHLAGCTFPAAGADVAKLAACPGLSALAVALQRSIAILQVGTWHRLLVALWGFRTAVGS